ncbi:MAG: ABC transporter permease subunit [Saccharofermentanales bacterium]
MYKLIKSEVKKFYIHNATILVFLLVLLVVFFAGLSLKSQQEIVHEDWVFALQQENQKLGNILNDPSIGMTEGFRNEYIAKLVVNQYRIDNDLAPTKVKSASNFLLYINNLFIIIIGLTIFITAKIFTDEYKDETILFLLSSPNYRWKILTSKLISSFLMPIALTVFLLFTSIMIGWSFFGFDRFSSTLVTFNNGEILTSPLLQQVLLNFAFSSIGLIVCVILTILISIISKSGVLSVIASISIYYAGSVISYNLTNYEWLKYTLFPNINFQIYLTNNIPFEGMTPSFSLIIVSLYSIPMLMLSYYLFNKQEF